MNGSRENVEGAVPFPHHARPKEVICAGTTAVRGKDSTGMYARKTLSRANGGTDDWGLLLCSTTAWTPASVPFNTFCKDGRSTL